MKAKKKNNVILIGAGNVATQLGLALRGVGHTILQVYSPTKKSADALSTLLKTKSITDLGKISTKADIYIIAVKDDTLVDVVKGLELKNKIVVHTSGSTAVNILKGVSKNYGVFYPLQTFSKNKRVNFQTIPICLEANNPDTFKIIKALAESISKNVQKVNSDQRKAIHVAAVFACNFSNHLYTIASEILSEYKLSFDILKPLIRETADKVEKYTPAKMQTGPAVRGDKKIMDVHLKMLSGNKERRKLYELLSQSIIASGEKNK